MANNTAIYAVMALGLAGGVGWWYMNNQDKTPVGLVVTNQVESARMPMGETSDGKAISANAIEGTWRESEDSLSVASESAEKPLMVIYHDGKPVNAKVVTVKEWIIDGKNPAKEGVTHSVHSECLSERLYIEKPEGFIYGRVTLPGKKKEAKITK